MPTTTSITSTNPIPMGKGTRDAMKQRSNKRHLVAAGILSAGGLGGAELASIGIKGTKASRIAAKAGDKAFRLSNVGNAHEASSKARKAAHKRAYMKAKGLSGRTKLLVGAAGLGIAGLSKILHGKRIKDAKYYYSSKTDSAIGYGNVGNPAKRRREVLDNLLAHLKDKTKLKGIYI